MMSLPQSETNSPLITMEPPAFQPHLDDATAQAASATINSFLQQNDLQFSVDIDPNTKVVKVIDTATREVIRQMPSQEMLAISKALGKFQGLLQQGKT